MSERVNVRLRHMKVLVEVVRSGSLVAASRVLHVTPAAVSKALRELENEVGAVLLLRNKAGVKLTAEGRVFHKHATESLISLSRALSSVQTADETRERLRIGALPTVASSLVPQALEILYGNATKAAISVITGQYEDLAAALRSGDIDIIVGRIITRDTLGLSFEELYEEVISVVVSARHPLTKAPLDLNDLSDYPAVLTPKGTTVRDATENFYFANNIREHELMIETSSDGFARSYVSNGNAIWFAPAGLVQLDILNGHLERLPIEHASLRAVIGLTTRTDEALVGPVLRFVETIRKISNNPSCTTSAFL